MYLSKNEEKTVKILLCFLDPIFLYQSFIKDAIVDEIDVAERVGYQKKKKEKRNVHGIILKNIPRRFRSSRQNSLHTLSNIEFLRRFFRNITSE